MRRNSKGRFVKGSGKRRRRHNPRKVSRRVAKRRPAEGYVVGHAKIRRRKLNPRHRRHHAKRRHSNPRFSVGGIVSQLKAGGIGAIGGILNALVIGFIGPKLPSSINTGYPLHAARIATALGIGIAGKKFAGRMGEQMGEGAMVVAMYLLLKDVASTTVPSLPLGDYQEITLANPGSVLSSYLEGPRSAGHTMVGDPGVGSYLEGMESTAEY